MSRRNIYVLGGLAVVLGLALIVVAVATLSSDGTEQASQQNGAAGGGDQPATTGTAPTPRPAAPGGSRAVTARGPDIGKQLARSRPVRAPDFTAEVIHAGTLPQPLEERFDLATAGGKLQISKVRPAPVVLHLWSVQCAPCRADARLVEATWKRWAPRNVLFVGVHVNERDQSAARAVIRQYGLSHPAVVDPRGTIAARYGATALPQTFFLSGRGAVVGEVVGSPSVRQLEVGAAAAKAGRPFGSEQGSTRVPLR